MGFREIEVTVPTCYSDEELRSLLFETLGIRSGSYTVSRKSLDARHKRRIVWLIRAGVVSDELPGLLPALSEPLCIPKLSIPFSVIIVGTGPAGIFAARILARAGCQVTVIEQGPMVEERKKDIQIFEATQHLDDSSNYAFGEGGAGTFSDGKLTSRTKTITQERRYVTDTYIGAGAPPEIAYLQSPHLGSDNLFTITKTMRQSLINQGVTFLFNTKMTDLEIKNGICGKVVTDKGDLSADAVVICPGHSSYDTFRMLMRNGILFRVKPFAIGFRAEHRQEDINLQQWGQPSLRGVKAAEYAYKWKEPGFLPVYSFCMCPGGRIVPATPHHHLSVVNGASDFARDGAFANAAFVAGFHPEQLLKKDLTPIEIIDWLEQLEHSFFTATGSYSVPANTIASFIKNSQADSLPASSFPFPFVPHDPASLLPAPVSASLRAAFSYFSSKMPLFEQGIIAGLESKTSSPVQVIREEKRYCAGISNLYIAGEGSGWAGGIVSSAADGIKAALSVISEAIT